MSEMIIPFQLRITSDEHKVVMVQVEFDEEWLNMLEEEFGVTAIFSDRSCETASSICSENDKFDFDTGLQIAAGRALRQLGRKLLSSGNAKVNQQARDRKLQATANKQMIERRKKARKQWDQLRNEGKVIRAKALGKSKGNAHV